MNRKIKNLILLAIIPPMILSVFLVSFEIWPATEVITWQTKAFDGRYYLKLTIILTWAVLEICFVLVPLILLLIFQRVVKKLKTK